MLLSRMMRPAALASRLLLGNASKSLKQLELQRQTKATHFRSGAIKPKPEETPFALMFVFCAVVPGLFVGAAISKSVANFLEENDLFVPSDDDDDDDDDD